MHVVVLIQILVSILSQCLETTQILDKIQDGECPSTRLSSNNSMRGEREGFSVTGITEMWESVGSIYVVSCHRVHVHCTQE